MLHEVRIYGADGTIKRVISRDEVVRQNWRRLREIEDLGFRRGRRKLSGGSYENEEVQDRD